MASAYPTSLGLLLQNASTLLADSWPVIKKKKKKQKAKLLHIKCLTRSRSLAWDNTNNTKRLLRACFDHPIFGAVSRGSSEPMGQSEDRIRLYYSYFGHLRTAFTSSLCWEKHW